MAEDQGYAPEQGGAGTGSPKDDGRTVVDAVADLLQTVVDYLRQEAGALVRDKVAAPLQRVGLVIAWAMAAASVFVIGVLFVSAGVLLVLAQWLGWPGALFLVGGVMLLGFVVFTALKMRSMRDVAADER